MHISVIIIQNKPNHRIKGRERGHIYPLGEIELVKNLYPFVGLRID